jgi:Zn-dependent protease
MLLQLLLSNPLLFVIVAGALVISLTIHEFSHAFVAEKLGDPTPRLQGRITLNPMAHLDPMGTLAMLIVGFGWGKPVMFDPFNLKDPKRDAALIALAGPASNLLLATGLAIILRIFPALPFALDLILPLVISTNVGLAIFNLIPIHPLDGGKILIGLAPRDVARDWGQVLHQYGTVILLFLIIPFNGQSAVSALISPIVSSVLRLLIG